jgi:hypothetical protein
VHCGCEGGGRTVVNGIDDITFTEVLCGTAFDRNKDTEFVVNFFDSF